MQPGLLVLVSRKVLALRSGRDLPLRVVSSLTLLLVLAASLPAQPDEEPTEPKRRPPEVSESSPLPPPYDDWFLAARPFLSLAEIRVFFSLERDYQRDAFIDRFWAVRDPYPETARNELRERFDYWSKAIPEVYGTFHDARGRILMLHGRAANVVPVRCSQNRPAEIWVYPESRRLRQPFFLVFRQRSPNQPAELLSADEVVALLGSSACQSLSYLNDALNYVRTNPDSYEYLLRRVLQRPRPSSEEWLATFEAFSTDLEAGTPELPFEISFEFPGRYDSRTVVQTVLAVSGEEAAVGDLRGHRSIDFLLVGEVVRGDRLFESFRYQFGHPVVSDRPRRVPLAFQRYLRPGEYRLVLKLEDLNGASQGRYEGKLVVPAVDTELPPPPPTDPETARIFAEAAEAVEAGRPTIRIVPPGGDILAGFVRFDTLAVGPEIDRVRFSLDDRELMTKTRPPYNVEIDLGEIPQLHSLRVEALDADGEVVASDERFLNAGSNRFAVRLLSPTSGDRYHESLEAEVDVQLPEGRSLERLEFYLNENLVATLFQPPWVQPIALESPAAAYVRTVAYLPDGHSTEDLVFVNAPGDLEAIDVQTVELYASVLNRSGRPVAGLEASDFRIEEDGVEQTLKRFDWLTDIPIHTGIVIDNSASMRSSLNEVKVQALQFLSQTITSRDRAAIVTFNRFPRLAVPLTNDLQALGGGLAGLTAEGGTSLYDSLVFSLYYFTGIKGKRALLLLSDGKDESSQFSFDEAIEFARRAGVTVYSVGLRIPPGVARSRLEQVAQETGGQAYFIREVGELEAIYAAIEEELRSQYLLVYQSNSLREDGDFREVELTTRDRELEVRTMSGYYP